MPKNPNRYGAIRSLVTERNAQENTKLFSEMPVSSGEALLQSNGLFGVAKENSVLASPVGSPEPYYFTLCSVVGTVELELAGDGDYSGASIFVVVGNDKKILAYCTENYDYPVTEEEDGFIRRHKIGILMEPAFTLSPGTKTPVRLTGIASEAEYIHPPVDGESE